MIVIVSHLALQCVLPNLSPVRPCWIYFWHDKWTFLSSGSREGRWRGAEIRCKSARM